MSTKLIETTKKGVEVYELSDDKIRVRILSFGARIANIFVKNKYGEEIDVVAGFNDPDEFLTETFYFNGVVGRVANRIGEGRLVLNGKSYPLTQNDGVHSLHGGNKGFDRRFWTAKIEEDGAVLLSYRSQDGEEGYPGNLDVTARYKVEDGALILEYGATGDRDTVCSLTNHANFNLSGDFVSALDHEVWINADALTAIDDEFIARGELVKVKGTPYDFTTPKTIGRDIKTDDVLLKIARGYDFNYVLNNNKVDPVAYAYCEKSGVRMDVYTDRDCMQFYTGNFLNGIKGKKTYGYQSAFCMETQGYPNAVNVPAFPSVVLKQGERYAARVAYKFSVR